MGDWVASDLAQAAEDDELVARACREIVARGRDRRAWLCFCCGVAHAEMVRAELERLGVAVALVTGETPSDERAETLRAFKAGELRAVVNVNVLTTGFDYPAIDMLCLLRPTMSKSLHVQMCGRGMRTAEGKVDCRILDFSGNCRRHGDMDLLQSYEQSEADLEREETARQAAAARRERLAKHTGEAEDIDGGASDLELTVRDVRYSVAEAKAQPGKRNVVVDYHTSGPTVRLWLCVEYQGGARWHAQRWFARRGLTMPWTAGEALALARRAPRPEAIVARRDGRWWRVVMEHMPDAAA